MYSFFVSCAEELYTAAFGWPGRTTKPGFVFIRGNLFLDFSALLASLGAVSSQEKGPLGPGRELIYANMNSRDLISREIS